MGLTGISNDTSTRTSTRTTESVTPTKTTPSAPEKPLSERSKQDLGSLGGVSAFDKATPAGPQRPVSETELVDRLSLTTVDVSRATEVLEAANEVVKQREETLAKELAHLAPSLSTEELQAYADSYRADHAEDYSAAEQAAAQLSTVLRDKVPGALEAAAGSPSLRAGWANSYLVDRVSDATAALQQYVSQSPTGDDALQRSLTQTVDRLALVSTVAGGVSTGLEGVSHLTSTLSELASGAGNAFGIVGSAASLASTGKRILDGNGRAEHYVGAAVSVAEIGVGVAAVAGVTVGLPVTATLAAVGFVANGISNARDRAELESSVTSRLLELGYSEQTAEGLAQLGPKAGAQLRDAGYSVEDIRSLVMLAPDLVESGELGRLASVTKGLELEGDQMMELIESLGPQATDTVMGMLNLSIEGQTMGVTLDRQTMIGLLRRDGLDAAAAFLERLPD